MCYISFCWKFKVVSDKEIKTGLFVITRALKVALHSFVLLHKADFLSRRSTQTLKHCKSSINCEESVNA